MSPMNNKESGCDKYDSSSPYLNEYDTKTCVHLSQCVYFSKFKALMLKYNKSDETIESDNVIDLFVNGFLHLISTHNNDQQFEYIYNDLGAFCNIKLCSKFKRNNRNRNERNLGTETKECSKNPNTLKHAVIQQIMDKVHCYYSHCFGVGYRLTQNEKDKILNLDEQKHEIDILTINNERSEIIKLIHSKIKTTNNLNGNNRIQRFVGREKFKTYSNGCIFHYDPIACKSCQHKQLHAKYASLKEELTSNSICIISVIQFQTEYGKASVHHQSQYNKQITHLRFDHILSVMFYSNYDQLQSELTKTFRYLHENETRKELEKRHCNFYFWAKNLKDVVTNSGTQFKQNDQFYRGVAEELILLLDFEDIYNYSLNGPVSTSLSFEVAVNFTNNKGIIIEFGYECKMVSNCGVDGPRYLSVSWMSDYAAERERFFFGSTFKLKDIISTKFTCQYKQLLAAIQVIDYCIRGLFEPIVTEETKKLCSTLICHELSYSLCAYEASDSLNRDPYTAEMMHQFCMGINTITVDWNKISINKYEWFFKSFCFSKYQWVQLHSLLTLFPKCKSIKVYNMKLCISTMDNIIQYLDNQSTDIDEICIYNIQQDSLLNITDAMSKYGKSVNKDYLIKNPYDRCIIFRRKNIPLILSKFLNISKTEY
eukprot:311337_1